LWCAVTDPEIQKRARDRSDVIIRIQTMLLRVPEPTAVTVRNEPKPPAPPVSPIAVKHRENSSVVASVVSPQRSVTFNNASTVFTAAGESESMDEATVQKIRMLGMRAATKANKRFESAVKLQCFFRKRQAQQVASDMKRAKRLVEVIRPKLAVSYLMVLSSSLE
jgi:hypothetical protein